VKWCWDFCLRVESGCGEEEDHDATEAPALFKVCADVRVSRFDFDIDVLPIFLGVEVDGLTVADVVLFYHRIALFEEL